MGPFLRSQHSARLHLIAEDAQSIRQTRSEFLRLLQERPEAPHLLYVDTTAERIDGVHQWPTRAQFERHEIEVGAEKRVRPCYLPAYAIDRGTWCQARLAA